MTSIFFKNSDKQCVVNASDGRHIRTESVRMHNRAIGIQQPFIISDGVTKTSRSYERDA
ncbi:hypothetical protein [Vibrio coralliilyticus]